MIWSLNLESVRGIEYILMIFIGFGSIDSKSMQIW